MSTASPNDEQGARRTIANLMAGRREGDPTWLQHSVSFRSRESIEEMGKALNMEYPYFLAVLSPERTFLHYVISGLICNVSLANRKQLEENVEALYKANVDTISKAYEENKDSFKQDIAACEKAAEAFFDKRHNGFAVNLDEILDRTPGAFDFLKHFTKALPASYSFNPHEAGMKLQAMFEEVYTCIKSNSNSRETAYVAGKIDTVALTDIRKVFTAICVDRIREQQIKDITKPVADGLIRNAISSGQLRALPQKSAEDCRYIVIAGVTAAGKTRLLDAIEKKGDGELPGAAKSLLKRLHLHKPVVRADSVMIDIDEFRDLDRILGRTDAEKADPKWGDKIHDECHIIRRKIMDEIEKKGRLGINYDVVLTTAHLSSRIRDWLIEDNKHVDMFFLYCDPEKALHNAEVRSERDGGYSLPVRTVLKSFKNLAHSFRYVFNMEIGEVRNLTVQIINTNKVDVTKPVNAAENLKDMKPILTADGTHGVQVHDFDDLWNVYSGFHIKSKAPANKHEGYYKLDERNLEELKNTVVASLRPHRVTFLSKKDPHHISAHKDASSDHLKGTTRSLFAEYPKLAELYQGQGVDIADGGSGLASRIRRDGKGRRRGE